MSHGEIKPYTAPPTATRFEGDIRNPGSDIDFMMAFRGRHGIEPDAGKFMIQLTNAELGYVPPVTQAPGVTTSIPSQPTAEARRLMSMVD